MEITWHCAWLTANARANTKRYRNELNKRILIASAGDNWDQRFQQREWSSRLRVQELLCAHLLVQTVLSCIPLSGSKLDPRQQRSNEMEQPLAQKWKLYESAGGSVCWGEVLVQRTCGPGVLIGRIVFPAVRHAGSNLIRSDCERRTSASRSWARSDHGSAQ